jgi:hypothetical protein
VHRVADLDADHPRVLASRLDSLRQPQDALA